jgi:hypothetical protein
MITVEELKKAYDDVYSATESMQNAGITYEKAKERLDIAILKSTASGEIVGSNEGARKAAALQLYENDFIDKDQKEAEYKNRSNELDLAKIHLYFLKDCIRIYEIAKE